MIIIPAIDLKENQVVRLFQGDYAKVKVYGKDPISYAKLFESLGAKRIHVVDLEGAKEGKPIHKDLILKLAKSVSVPVQVGGGIREREHLEVYIKNGISQVIIGTKAIESLDWLKEICLIYPNKVIVSVDVRGDKVALSGWLKLSQVNYLEFIEKLNELTLFAIIVTLIERDGTQAGVETSRLREALKVSKHPLILAGGVSTIEDIKRLKEIDESNFLGVITGRAIYEGTLDLREAIQLTEDGSNPT